MNTFLLILWVSILILNIFNFSCNNDKFLKVLNFILIIISIIEIINFSIKIGGTL